MVRGDQTSVALAEMDDEVAEWNVLGGFKSALDLVHCVDAARLLRMKHVDAGRAGATHFSIGVERSVHGKGLKRIGAEPCAEFGHVLAAGVVKMLAGGKDLNSLSARTGGQFQESRMQALIEENMCGEDAEHGEKVPRAGPG